MPATTIGWEQDALRWIRNSRQPHLLTAEHRGGRDEGIEHNSEYVGFNSESNR